MKHWHTELDRDGILWAAIDVAEGSANVLGSEVLEELGQLLNEAQLANPRGMVIHSGKPSGFVAGADVRGFRGLFNPHDVEGFIRDVHGLFDRLAALPFATVAMIHGFCLGGGLELALACRYRVASDAPSTRLGFPEVRLGIFPGFGGTFRAIDTIGALHALPLMLSGRTLDARKAARLGLVDHAVPERQLRATALELLRTRPEPHRASWPQRFVNSAPVRQLAAEWLERKTRKSAAPDHYPAPFALIDHWRRNGSTPEEMRRGEVDGVARLLTGDIAQNLIRIFFLQERLKQLGRGYGGEFNQIHVVGGGTMGGDIAAWCALRGLRVTLQDREPRLLSAAMGRAMKLFRQRLKEPRLVQAAWDRLTPDHRGHGITRADLIVEAIYEDLDAKRTLFAELERRARADAILASNTSSIPIDAIATALREPERLVGIHFFNPVARMQLVEVVNGWSTDPRVTHAAAAFARTIDRLPLPVRSTPGFLVNRILMPYLLEAVELLREGVPAPLVDRAAERFGMPMGPVELADRVGLDICLSVAEKLADKLHVEVPQRLHDAVAAGHLGRKSGRGFYTYRDGRPLKPESKERAKPPADLADRLIFRLLNESVACLREGVVADAELLDAGVVFGTGFAPFRGGPMRYIETGGLARMRERLSELQRDHGPHFNADAGWASLGQV